MKKYCPKCGRRLGYKILYNHGDPNLGVSWEGWWCSEHGYIKPEDLRHDATDVFRAMAMGFPDA